MRLSYWYKAVVVLFMVSSFVACNDDDTEQDTRDEESAVIRDYLRRNKLDAPLTEDGIYYWLIEEGTGSKLQTGDTVTIDYTLTNLRSNRVVVTTFADVAIENYLYTDTSTVDDFNPIQFLNDENGTRLENGQPKIVTFTDSQGTEYKENVTVVKGVLYGVRYMKVGEHAKFLIPSEFAFGSTGTGDIIDSDTPLLYDIYLRKAE